MNRIISIKTVEAMLAAQDEAADNLLAYPGAGWQEDFQSSWLFSKFDMAWAYSADGRLWGNLPEGEPRVYIHWAGEARPVLVRTGTCRLVWATLNARTFRRMVRDMGFSPRRAKVAMRRNAGFSVPESVFCRHAFETETKEGYVIVM